MTAEPPVPFPISPYCRVRARVASIWADGPDDGTHPDWRPAAGDKVTLTPSIGSNLLVYDVGGTDPIIVTVERVDCEVDADGWLVKSDGRPVYIAPTDDPLLSATGWTWTANIKGKSVPFSAPTGGVVELALFIAAPATDDTKVWVERIPEMITAGTTAVDAAAEAVAARDTATEQAGLAITARIGAEAARDEAVAYAEGTNVQVGGRNLLPTRRELYDTSQTYGFWRLKADDDPSELLLTVYDNDPTVELPSGAGTYFGFTGAGGSNNGGVLWAMSAGTLVSRTRVSDYPFFSIYPRTRETFGAIFSRYRIKIEKGGHATDWTPAPEDVGVNPDTAQWAAPHSLALELADAAALAAASTIVGAGRPDIPATLTTEVATRVAAATSGAVFRSTDGPQGAWEWRKRGTTWVVTIGDTGWRDVSASLIAPIQLAAAAGSARIRRIGSTVHVALRVEFAAAAGNRAGRTPIMPLPLGFRAANYTPHPSGLEVGLAGGGATTALITTGGGLDRLDVQAPSTSGAWATADAITGSGHLLTDATWPTTLPGSAS